MSEAKPHDQGHQSEHMDDSSIDWKLYHIEVDKLGDLAEKIGKVIEDIARPLCITKPSAPKPEEQPGEPIDPNTRKEEDQAFTIDEDKTDRDLFEDDEYFAPIEQKVAQEVKRVLDEQFKSNWTVLVGNGFWSDLNLLDLDRYGKYMFGSMYLEIFELNVHPVSEPTVPQISATEPEQLRTFMQMEPLPQVAPIAPQN